MSVCNNGIVPMLKNPVYQERVELHHVNLIKINALLDDYIGALYKFLIGYSCQCNDTILVRLPLNTTYNNEFYICFPKCTYKKDIENKHPWLKLLQGWEKDFIPLAIGTVGWPQYPSHTAEVKNIRDRYSEFKEALQSHPNEVKKEIMSLLTQECSEKK
jgi:hypothetical protein